VRERPILFSAPMVRALLAGTKTQTRRVVKPQFAADAIPVEMPATDPAGGWVVPGHSGVWWCDAAANPDDVRRCPYGKRGEKLWVKETWRIGAWDENEGAFAIDYCDGPDKTWRKTPETPEGEDLFNRLWYQSTDELWAKGIKPDPEGNYHWQPGESPLRWRPSIHMPRWASRITLEITSVRVERLQDISEADAIAEGCTQNHNGYFWGGPHQTGGLKQMATALQAYQDLWESINGPGSWDANPWVWVLEFCRINSKEIESCALQS